MKTDAPQTTYLKNYKPYPYSIERLNLDFKIHDGYTLVKSRMEMKRVDSGDIYLYGEALELLSLRLDGDDVVDYIVDEAGLTIPAPVADSFVLEIETKIKPEKNTRLEGLYQSGGNYCTQCEAEGFRRITYFPDRPDVMSVYTVRVEADKKYSVLLSNGNLREQGEVDGGRHYAVWHDPFKKPCYLFALVAGDLTHIHDTFTTMSGREVDLYVYVRPGDENQCAHAMESLKKSMKWDEEVYGLEYDLDIFNIVAVSDFNMGAMENKSLNIFNTALVLAAPETATDSDFMRVESVIAHEYFHNWSGNRVTCRDWFQLSLKEGLTVFRDQEFSADIHSAPVQRIDDVSHLRRLQFVEDSSPLAHPIRPEEYIEINNFYTMTVYEKGAEVIRMFRTLMGAETYRKATDLYFSRHDGDAATCEDWIACMAEASGLDLEQFRLWYSQAGTPEVSFKGEYNEKTKSYNVLLKQSILDTAGQKGKKPMHIPVAIGLLGANGNDLIETQILHLKEAVQEFVIENVALPPIPSVLRGFSAPVKLKVDYTPEQLAFLMVHDSDGFNRWDAAQRYYTQVVHEVAGGGEVSDAFLSVYGDLLEAAAVQGADKALMARMLAIPDVVELGQSFKPIDPVEINKARDKILAAIKRTHRKALDDLYQGNSLSEVYAFNHIQCGRRSLRSVVLGLLTATNGTGCAKTAKTHYEAADNMTDRMAALNAVAANKNAEREDIFGDFYERFKSYPLVVDKWFSSQAMAVRSDIIDCLNKLKQHPDFNIKNPNRVRSLYAAFAMNNPVGFHAVDGSGYMFLRDGIIELNGINPQIAARLLTAFRSWRDYTPDRQEKMKAALEAILAIPNIAPDVFEIASKSLKG